MRVLLAIAVALFLLTACAQAAVPATDPSMKAQIDAQATEIAGLKAMLAATPTATTKSAAGASLTSPSPAGEWVTIGKGAQARVVSLTVQDKLVISEYTTYTPKDPNNHYQIIAMEAKFDGDAADNFGLSSTNFSLVDSQKNLLASDMMGSSAGNALQGSMFGGGKMKGNVVFIADKAGALLYRPNMFMSTGSVFFALPPPS